MRTAPDALTFIDYLMVSRYGRPLTPPERLVVLAAWQEQTYSQVAARHTNQKYKAATLRHTVAPKLWRILTEIVEEPVTKSNFRVVLPLFYDKIRPSLPPEALSLAFESFLSMPGSVPIVGVEIPYVGCFYGRRRELEMLGKLIRTHRCLVLVGVEGIGKRTLAARLVTQGTLPFDRICWKPVHHRPTPEQFIFDVLQLLTDEETSEEGQSLLSKLVSVLQTQRCLLVLDSAEALLEVNQAGYRQLVPGYYSFFRRVIEETQSVLLFTSQEIIPELEDGFSLRGYPATSFPIGGLDIQDAKQFFVEAGLSDEDLWEEAIVSLGRHPLLLRQIASWVKTRLGGSFSDLGQKTSQLGIVQVWFDELFRDPLYLSIPDRRVLLDLAQYQQEFPFEIGISVADLIQRNRVSAASIDRLLRSALMEVRLDSEGGQKRFGLSPLLQKYLLTDPRGLVSRPGQSQLRSGS